MGSQVVSTEVAASLDSFAAAIGRVRRVGLVPVDARDAAVLVRELECLGRQVDALRVGVVEEVDRRGLHRVDGHHSAKVFVRHHGSLSDVEAARRAQAMRALRDLPTVAAALTAGRIGMDQVGVLARAHANPRVRAALVRQEADAARMAGSMGFERFAATIRDWTRLSDADGTIDGAVRNHRNRRATLRLDADGSMRLSASCGKLRGEVHRSILEAFIAAEWERDWADARAAKGEAACREDLARTDAQRAADAVDEIFQAAADGHAAAPGGSRIVTNVVIDEATFERELRRMAGQRRTPAGDLPLVPDHTTDADLGGPADGDLDLEPTPDQVEPADHLPGSPAEPDRPSAPTPTSHQDDPGDDRCEAPARSSDPPGPPASPEPPDPPGPPDRTEPPVPARRREASEPPVRVGSRVGFRASTLDGHPVDPAEIAADALLGHVRRVVIGAASVVVDLGRTQRCFTGAAALAVKLGHEHCAWPGCHVPTTGCQSDHLTSWATGGRTVPGNGALLCGHHNRTKELGYRITRDERGRLHTYRPDGTEIT